MKKLLFSAAAVTVLFAACTDKDTNPAPQSTKFFLNSVSEYDSSSVTYNAGNQIATFTSIAKGEDYAYYSEAVYEGGKLTEVRASEKSPTALVKAQTYEYDANGKLLKVRFYSEETGDMTQYDSIAYDNSGRVASLYQGFDPGEFSSKSVFVWDGKGNVAKQYGILITDGEEATDTVKTEYTFDDKVNLFAKQPGFYLLHPEEVANMLSTNNVTKASFSYSTFTIEEKNEFTYDSDNYPVTNKNTSTAYQNGGVIDTRVENIKIRYINK
ncbi:hypothetical protein [Chitinophaga sp. S165]|uniref:hypothetical protein n=1 Tax=Chitinophaga sp. S165 TaxID=2135462 RepID=UPI000D70F142|nr:hypothetical protein [Chitinophaga sp. S165]PWV51605.1 hypothetical protein C7475_103215 [Chitinophaga sp. S165]